MIYAHSKLYIVLVDAVWLVVRRAFRRKANINFLGYSVASCQLPLVTCHLSLANCQLSVVAWYMLSSTSPGENCDALPTSKLFDAALLIRL